MLVEPEGYQCHQVSEYSVRAHYLVDIAPTFAAALEKLTQHEFDFVLLSQQLPGGEGLALLRESGRLAQPASSIVLTSSGAVEDRLRGFDQGADDCVPKTVAA